MKPKITFFVDQEVLDRLKELSRITRIPQAIFLREAMDDVLEKYRGEFKKAEQKRK